MVWNDYFFEKLQIRSVWKQKYARKYLNLWAVLDIAQRGASWLYLPSSAARGVNFTRLRWAGQKTRAGNVECIQKLSGLGKHRLSCQLSCQYVCNHNSHHVMWVHTCYHHPSRCPVSMLAIATHTVVLSVYLQLPPTQLSCQRPSNCHPHSCPISVLATTTHTVVLPASLQLPPTQLSCQYVATATHTVVLSVCLQLPPTQLSCQCTCNHPPHTHTVVLSTCLQPPPT
jgi:hypothetical protein